LPRDLDEETIKNARVPALEDVGELLVVEAGRFKIK
jgi:hypothetical protein